MILLAHVAVWYCLMVYGSPPSCPWHKATCEAIKPSNGVCLPIRRAR